MKEIIGWMNITSKYVRIRVNFSLLLGFPCIIETNLVFINETRCTDLACDIDCHAPLCCSFAPNYQFSFFAETLSLASTLGT